MADILLSYTHPDRERVRPLIDLLEEEGWDVWWDREIEPGTDWENELNVELMESNVILVVWSKISKQSKWVNREANVGWKRNNLVEVMIDLGEVPEGFGENKMVTDLSKWKGQKDLDEINALLQRLGKQVTPSRIDTIRPGFDINFLGEDHEILLPGVKGAAAIYKYLHFSVIMNPGRRLAHYVAYNIDGNQMVKDSSFRRQARWVSDPLLAEPLQINMQLTRQSPYDRGHLISPASVRWGDERSALIAARQCYYMTNVSPQLQFVNRKSWLMLEKYERDLAIKYGKVSGFSGPVFSPSDEPFRDKVELEDGLIARETFHIPKAFWKVITFLEKNKLRAVGFIVYQEQLPPDQIKLHHLKLSLKDLEKIAHIQLEKELHLAESQVIDGL